MKPWLLHAKFQACRFNQLDFAMRTLLNYIANIHMQINCDTRQIFDMLKILIRLKINYKTI